MNFINFLRIFKRGAANFQRNGWLGAATISVMAITLFVIGSLFVANDLFQNVAQDLQDKIDISAYFREDAPEEKILEARKFIMQNPQVKSVEYVSKDEAYQKFKETHKDDSAVLDSLQELGTNPLFASLNIKAASVDSFSYVADSIESSKYKEFIREVNYKKNQTSIEKFFSIVSFVRKSGLFTALILAVIVILITFNTIRLTIYTHKQEIEIMKLVGGTNWFIRGPFIIEGILYGILACAAAMFMLYMGIAAVSSKITGFLPSSDLLSFYKSSFWNLLAMELAIGAILGSTSSFIAIRKYLNQ